MDGDSPHQISRLDHCMQTATRAENDGAWWWNSCLCPASRYRRHNFARKSFTGRAALLRSYVSERNYWIALHYGLFQGYYWMHHSDEDSRDALKNSPYYEACAEFYECGRSDIIRSKAWNKTSWALLNCLEAGSLSTTRFRQRFKNRIIKWAERP